MTVTEDRFQRFLLNGSSEPPPSLSRGRSSRCLFFTPHQKKNRASTPHANHPESNKLIGLNELIEPQRIHMPHEMGNIELFELGQISRTVQCHSCLKHLPEGLAFCSCGVCLRADEATMKRINARFFDSTLVPYPPKSLKGQEAWRNSVATRPFQSNGCQKGRMEAQQGHCCNQVATG